MIFKGIPVSKGIAVGKVFVYNPYKPKITEKTINPNEVSDALVRYDEVKLNAENELSALREKMALEDKARSEIFQAHIEILNDCAIYDEVVDLIKNSFFSPEYAVDTVYEKYIDLFKVIDDELIRERWVDLKDVKNRLLRIFENAPHKDLSELDEASIVTAHDLLPSDTAVLDRSKVLAIVAEIGGGTSHSAILAKGYEIPALLGVEHILDNVSDGETVIVDALDGKIITAPTQYDIDFYSRQRHEYMASVLELKKYRFVEPVTKDGERLSICLNIGSVSDDELLGAAFTDGVGLFRSEFLFMAGTELPSENRQFEAYKKAASTFAQKQVILRTLDIGGDKTLECMNLPNEDNPSLGCRALRLCFEHEDIFRTQLRAALRAGVYGNLAIMFPMVGSIDDIKRAMFYVEQMKCELEKESIPFNKNIETGIMIEIPSIALIADIAAKETDFASIGTNDLCQYLTASDRLNPAVNQYYQSYHPSMFRIIKYVSDCYNNQGKTVSICGEMAADPLCAVVFYGLGIKKLSMTASSVAPVKKVLTAIDSQKAKMIAQNVLLMHTAQEIEDFLHAELDN